MVRTNVSGGRNHIEHRFMTCGEFFFYWLTTIFHSESNPQGVKILGTLINAYILLMDMQSKLIAMIGLALILATMIGTQSAFANAGNGGNSGKIGRASCRERV